MKKIIINITILSFMSINSFAQKEIVSNPKWAFTAALSHQNELIKFDAGQLAVLDSRKFTPLIELGLEKNWRPNRKNSFRQTFILSTFNDRYAERQLGLGTDLGYQIKIFRGLAIRPSLGIHGILAKPVDVRYALNGEVWERVKNDDPVEARINSRIGLNLSYNINPKISIMAKTNLTIQTPYFDGLIPLWPMKSFGIGLNYSLNK